MKKLLFIILAGMLFSCKNTQKKETFEVQEPVKNLTKLEQLYLLPKDSIYDFYDLSNDSIKEFPDLSEYSIKKLDLSHNQIDSLAIKKLPKNIEDLNLSYNSFDYFYSGNTKNSLKKVDLSYNKINSCIVNFALEKFLIQNNDLTYLDINFKKLKYLNISNNPNFSNKVIFFPNKIDTIIHNNIANEKKLIYHWDGIIVE